MIYIIRLLYVIQKIIKWLCLGCMVLIFSNLIFSWPGNSKEGLLFIASLLILLGGSMVLNFITTGKMFIKKDMLTNAERK